MNLSLNKSQISECRKIAKSISKEVHNTVSKNTSVSIERTVLRLAGFSGAITREGHPYPVANKIIDDLGKTGKLNLGALPLISAVLLSEKSDLTKLNKRILNSEIDLKNKVDEVFSEKDIINDKKWWSSVKALSKELARDGHLKFKASVSEKKKNKRALVDPLKKYKNKRPLKYVIVATGNIHEDIKQADSAARLGADVIAVIRSTAQSLLDYVPEGATSVGFGGTYATQENFRLMREQLDETGAELGRYIRLTNYSSGLCMSEIAALGAMERLDCLLNDAMYGILFRDINMIRTLVDQHFSRQICAAADIQIQTGEDNYLTTDDAIQNGHTVLTSQFINERLAIEAGVKSENMALGHAMEMDPWKKNVIKFEIARAAMTREIFKSNPLKYMPPTKHMSGDIFFGHAYDTIFNLVSVMTNQGVHLLGMPTEAIHTPFLQDRWMAIKSANYIFNAAEGLSSEISFSKSGEIKKFADKVLDKSLKQMRKIKKQGFYKSIEKKAFANISRTTNGGKGFDGVIEKDKNYFNPFEKLFES
jgi:beta-lysine 5,6-aminomutase alpha subunit